MKCRHRGSPQRKLLTSICMPLWLVGPSVEEKLLLLHGSSSCSASTQLLAPWALRSPLSSQPPSRKVREGLRCSTSFPGSSSAFSGNIVFKAEQGVADPEVVEQMSAMFLEVDGIEEIGVVSPYSQMGASQISADGTVAFAQVNAANSIDQTTGSKSEGDSQHGSQH